MLFAVGLPAANMPVYMGIIHVFLKRSELTRLVYL